MPAQGFFFRFGKTQVVIGSQYLEISRRGAQYQVLFGCNQFRVRLLYLVACLQVLDNPVTPEQRLGEIKAVSVAAEGHFTLLVYGVENTVYFLLIGEGVGAE